MTKSFLLRLGRLARDRFLLGHADAIVRGYSPERQACIRQLYGAAAKHIALADESTDGWYAASAVTLYRKAIPLLASALLVSKNLAPPGPPLDLPTALAKIEELARAGELPALPASYENAKAILETPDHLTFAGMGAIKAGRGRVSVEALVQWLRRQIGPRSIGQIWVARVVRVSLAIAVVLLLIESAALIHWAIRRHL